MTSLLRQIKLNRVRFMSSAELAQHRDTSPRFGWSGNQSCTVLQVIKQQLLFALRKSRAGRGRRFPGLRGPHELGGVS
jgi:hypothetical protein